MKNKKEKIVPVLLGGDLNAYSVAMSFAEEFSVKSEVFAREKLAMTGLSSFINLHVVKELDDFNVAVPLLLDFAKNHRSEKLILVPCADWYVEMLEYARDALTEHFYFNIPDFKVWKTVTDKATFTTLIDRLNISHPRTEIFDENFSEMEMRAKNMKPPFVLKPSDSSEYWRHKFEGMKKVYFPASLDEAKRIGKRIYNSGYEGKLLLQEYIRRPNEKEPYASVLTVYMNRTGEAVRAVLGDVLLEEQAPTARGNYSAILTRPLDDMSNSLIKMLENIKYTGFANFDILNDGEKSYCLELNARQGRSFDYIRCADISLAQLLIADMKGVDIEPEFNYKCGLWRCVKRRTVSKYATDKQLLKRAGAIEKAHLAKTPYDFSEDKKLLRRFYVFMHLLRENKRYASFNNRKNILEP